MTFYEWPGVGRIADVPALGYPAEARRDSVTEINELADVVLFTISASFRIHAGDVKAIAAVRSGDTRCVVVVTQMDRLSSHHESQIVQYFKEKTSCPVVVVSAHTGQTIVLLRALIKEVAANRGRHSE